MLDKIAEKHGVTETQSVSFTNQKRDVLLVTAYSQNC